MLTSITGINWGDEGKGRMVDLLSQDYDIVARICEDWLNVFRLTAPSSGPWRRLKEGAKGTEFPI